jgi:hypothetical protein
MEKNFYRIASPLNQFEIKAFFSNKRSFSNTISLEAKEDRPKLKIDTSVASTGNEGLDKEKQWRDKAALCEHNKTSLYISDEKDNKDPLLCDVTHDFEDNGKTCFDKETNPSKHPAVEGDGDVAFICDNCHTVVCKDCVEEYSSTETTPVSPVFPFTEGSNFVSSIEETTSESSKEETTSESSKKETTSESSKEETKRSLIDDYADTSTELPDYMGGDD